MPRFSANLGFLWHELPLLERIDKAAVAGFKAIELHWPYDVPANQTGQACARNNLTLLGLNTSAGDVAKDEFGLGAVPGRQQDFQDSIEQAIAYCKASGATSIHVMAGVVSSGGQNRAYTVFKENLTVAARKAESSGLILLLEPINPRDKPNYFYSTLSEAVSLIEEIGSETIRLIFDVYHVGVTEGDVIMKLRRYKDLIGHIQIAAVPTRAEPDAGEIAYRAIFEEIDAIGYAGWVGCEYLPRGSVEEGLKWLRNLSVSL